MKTSPKAPLVCCGCGHRIVVVDGVCVGHYPTQTVPVDEDAPLCSGSYYPPVERKAVVA